MDIIRHLLLLLFKLAIALFASAVIWWLFVTLFPEARLRALFSKNGTSTVSGSWLPAPGSYKGVFGNASGTITSNEYKPGVAYNGWGNAYNNNNGGAQVDYVTYTTEGTQIIKGGQNSVFDSSQTLTKSQNVSSSGFADRSLYIRNLSIYEGGHVYTGLSFTGEARNTLFQNGKFPVVIVDGAGRVVTVSYAEATSNWSVPGWTRFQVKINGVLPNNIQCAMIFEEAKQQYTYNNSLPTRVAIPVMCN